MPAAAALYEINTRIFVRRFGPPAGLDMIPDAFLDDLAARGMDMLWAMGVWAGNPATTARCCFEPGLLDEYRRALPDFTQQDVIGSPYAIDHYHLNPALGDAAALARLRRRVNQRGLRLILDFVPNHFSEGSRLIKTDPELFLPAPPGWERAPKTYFRPAQAPALALAHGKDPNFDAWGDTVQVNYFCERGARRMLELLLEIAGQCDGVRCDMAMLALNEIFARTWGAAAAARGFAPPAEEFWGRAIAAVKARHPDFVFIAEAYWDLEWRLQQLGFDFTYDKRLYDRLRHGAARDVAGHLSGDPAYQRRMVRFIENHDEARAAEAFGERALAAAAAIAALPGLRFYHDGQFEGRRVKLPVQLGREPHEAEHPAVRAFYERLLETVQAPVFRIGAWSLTPPAACGDESYLNFLAFTWRLNEERRLTVINYCADAGQCHIRLDLHGLPDRVVFHELLQGASFDYAKSDLQRCGLYIALPGYGVQIFACQETG